MIPALTKEGLELFWLQIVARIGQAQQQITSSLGTLATKNKIVKTDLDTDIQVSLGKADSAIQVLPTYTKVDIGLGKVDNTADIDKPISTAQQAAINEVLEEVNEIKQELELAYDSDNPPPYPVISVNGQTGAIVLNTIPSYSTSNNNQFLKIVDGAPAWVAIQNAEGVNF